MLPNSISYLLLTAPKRWRRRIADVLRSTALWRPLRVVYHAVSPLWRNTLVRTLIVSVRRRFYLANPRGYWQRRGGEQYLRGEAFLLGPGSLTERQGRFLSEEIWALGARSVLEVGCGYGRMLKEVGRWNQCWLVGVDFSPSQLATARTYLEPMAVVLILSDATQGLPFRDSVFDVVYTQGSLMHVPPPLDRAYRSELARVARRYIIHTEDFQESESMFAHHNEGHYKELGCQLVKEVPYPFNLPGQTMKFQVFGLQKELNG